MKKALLTVLIILLVILLLYTVIQGWQIGSIDVLSYAGIRNMNSELDEQIQRVDKLKSRDYQEKLDEQQDIEKRLEEMKKQYEDLVSVNVGDGATPASQIERYEMEYLWSQIGNHAKAEGVTLSIDVSKSFDPTAVVQEEGEETEGENAENEAENTEENTTDMEAAITQTTSTGAERADDDLYDLSFTAVGKFVSVVDFINAIEEDSSLGFKIEDFKMSATYETKEVTSEFKCKGIRIKKVTRTSEEQKLDDEEEAKGNTTNTNSTNSTNTNKTTNTTNTTNSTKNTTR